MNNEYFLCLGDMYIYVVRLFVVLCLDWVYLFHFNELWCAYDTDTFSVQLAVSYIHISFRFLHFSGYWLIVGWFEGVSMFRYSFISVRHSVTTQLYWSYYIISRLAHQITGQCNSNVPSLVMQLPVVISCFGTQLRMHHWHGKGPQKHRNNWPHD